MRAAHLVQHFHLGWLDLTQYGLLVCNAALPETARNWAPDARWFGSFNAQMLTLAGPENPFWNSLREALLDYILLDAHGEPVQSSAHNTVYFDWRMLDGAKAYADWINENNIYDLYLDDYVAEIPPHRQADLPPPLVPELTAAWILWREALARELTGPRIANTAGMMDRRFDGICIEASHRARLSDVMTLARFVIQRGQWSVDWSGDWEVEGNEHFGIAKGEFLPK